MTFICWIRLSKLSSEEDVFIQAVPIYQEVLKQPRYNHKYYNNSDKYNSNKNNKANFSSNDKKNDIDYNKKFMINADDNSDNDNNKKSKKLDNHWGYIGGW